MNLEPNKDYVIIDPVKVEEKTEGGILLSSEAQKAVQEKQNRGTVLAVGSNCTWAKEGDFVSFYRGAAADYVHEGQSFLLINEAHILCKINGLANKLKAVI